MSDVTNVRRWGVLSLLLGSAGLLAAGSGGCAALTGLNGLDEAEDAGAEVFDAPADSSADAPGDTRVDAPDDSADSGHDDGDAQGDAPSDGDAGDAPDGDAGCDTSTVESCGTCGRACSTAQVDKAACSGGLCTSTCVAGFGNCAIPASPAPDDGCETALNTTTNCTSCGRTCDTASSIGATCAATGCTYAGCKSGFGDCNTAAPDGDGCETALTTILDCTACGTKCDTTTSIGTACSGTSCTYTGCKAGFADCITTAPDADGCETRLDSLSSCGACGRSCSLSHVATAGCSGVACSPICASGFGDCKTPLPPAADDGCETALNTTTSCSGCGIKCDASSSVGATCSGTSCSYTSCKAGFKDCDTTAPDANGCETAVNTTTNCGGCGVACDTVTSVGALCVAGKCVYSACAAGFADCDTSGANANGCETPTNTTTNCGGCGKTCADAVTGHDTGNACRTSPAPTTCTYTCAAGFDDCNKATAPDTDGCETNVKTSTTSCTACGVACDTTTNGARTCTGTRCSYTCNAGRMDCNASVGLDTDGCECASPSCCGTSCQTTHDNGVGQNFYDCSPLGTPGTATTYTLAMANEARDAWPVAGAVSTGSCGTAPAATGTCTCKLGAASATVWCYTGGLAGYVFQNSAAACGCPIIGDTTWN